jgi:hypothetical protein
MEERVRVKIRGRGRGRVRAGVELVKVLLVSSGEGVRVRVWVRRGGVNETKVNQFKAGGLPNQWGEKSEGKRPVSKLCFVGWSLGVNTEGDCVVVRPPAVRFLTPQRPFFRTRANQFVIHLKDFISKSWCAKCINAMKYEIPFLTAITLALTLIIPNPLFPNLPCPLTLTPKPYILHPTP